MNLLDRISKHLRAVGRESEAKVIEDEPILLTDEVDAMDAARASFTTPMAKDRRPAITPFSDIAAVDEHADNVADYLNEVKGIERRAKTVVAARVINADYDNSFDINYCADVGCNKAVNGCCMAYTDPTVLNWHRHGDSCPTGPYQASFIKPLAKKLNPLKASKRRDR